MAAVKLLLVISVTFPADFSDVTKAVSWGDWRSGWLWDATLKCPFVYACWSSVNVCEMQAQGTPGDPLGLLRYKRICLHCHRIQSHLKYLSYLSDTNSFSDFEGSYLGLPNFIIFFLTKYRVKKVKIHHLGKFLNLSRAVCCPKVEQVVH